MFPTYIGALYVVLPALLLLAAALVPTFTPTMPVAAPSRRSEAYARELVDMYASQAIRYAYAAHNAAMQGLDPTPMRVMAMRFYDAACEYHRRMLEPDEV